MIDQLDIIGEATRRALEDGFLSAGKPLNTPQKEGLLSYNTFLTAPTDHERIDKRRAYFDMATGTGKTGLFSVVARHAHHVARERGHGNEFKTIIVEPTTILLKQTHKELVTAAPELRDAIGIYGDRSKEINKPFTIMTYPAWTALSEEGALLGVDFEIDDESHHSLSDRRQQISRDNLSNAVRMGVTASAQYDNQKTMEVTHQNLIYKTSLRHSIERGFLTDYAHIQFALMRILPSLTEKKRNQFPKGELPVLKQHEWTKLVVHAYANLFDEISGQPLSDKVASFFAANTRHADDLANRLNNHPILQQKARDLGLDGVAISVHSVGQSPDEQDRRIEALRAGRYMAVTGDKKIGAGLDYPPIKFAACYPGNSLVNILQEIGRSTRYYLDPRSGQSQGTVIFEAVPYIGYADPEKDMRSQREALANTITAYEILKSSMVYAPARLSYKKDDTRPVHPKKSILLSPTVSAVVYTTEQDTLFVSRQIESAREELRILVTTEMLTDLRERLAVRGDYGGVRLVTAIEAYEAEKGLTTTGLLHYEITTILAEKVKSIQANQWQRLNEVVDNLPLVELHERIDVTPTMLIAIKEKIAERGGFSYRRLMQEVEKFEAARNLDSSGITEPTIARIIMSSIKTIESGQWQRLNELLDSLPMQKIGPRIDVTPLMLTTIKDKVIATGDYGAIRLMTEVEKYERGKKLEPVGLTHQVISRILRGDAKSIDTAHWQRLNDTIDNLSKVELGERIEITDDMYAALKLKIAQTGGHNAQRLVSEAKKYEAENKLIPVSFDVFQLTDVLRGKIKSIQLLRWQRLNEMLDSFPKNEVKERIVLERPKALSKTTVVGETTVVVAERLAFTTASLAELQNKIAARGGYGNKTLMNCVESFEEERGLQPTGLTAAIINTILTGYLHTVDKAQWERINEVVDSLPLQIIRKNIEISPVMREYLVRKIEAKGNFGARRLEEEIRRIEKTFKLNDVGIDEKTIGGILYRNVESVSEEQWDRLNAVLEILPTIGRRIEITATMREALEAKMRERGGLGASRLAQEVEVYEGKSGLQLSGLTQGILSSVLEGTVTSMLEMHWKRVQDTLSSLPIANARKTITITPEMYNDLSARLMERGGLSAKRLIVEIPKYEEANNLEPVGITYAIVHHLLGNRKKFIDPAHWERVNTVVDQLPKQETRKRINFTEEMHSELLATLQTRGGIGYRTLFVALKEYEQDKKLNDTGITSPIITTIIEGDLLTVDEAQWNRLNEVVLNLPLREPAKVVQITVDILDALRQKLFTKGNVGYKFLAEELPRFEEEENLPKTGLDRQKMSNVFMGRYKSIEEKDLQRLNELLDSLPDAKAPVMIPVTPEMIKELHQKRSARGNLGAVRLFDLSEAADSPVKLTVSYIGGIIQKGTKLQSTNKDWWERLHQVLDSLPIVDITQEPEAGGKENIVKRKTGKKEPGP